MDGYRKEYTMRNTRQRRNGLIIGRFCLGESNRLCNLLGYSNKHRPFVKDRQTNWTNRNQLSQAGTSVNNKSSAELSMVFKSCMYFKKY